LLIPKFKLLRNLLPFLLSLFETFPIIELAFILDAPWLCVRLMTSHPFSKEQIQYLGVLNSVEFGQF